MPEEANVAIAIVLSLFAWVAGAWYGWHAGFSECHAAYHASRERDRQEAFLDGWKHGVRAEADQHGGESLVNLLK